MTWPVKIRVYPENRALFATVYVWPTKKAMRQHARRVWQARDRFGAYCQTFRKVRVRADGRTQTSPEFAEVHFAVSQLGSETVTHEFTHAAWGWARRVGWEPEAEGEMHPMAGRFEMANEERFCYALGAMVRQFIDRAYTLGLYEPKDERKGRAA